MTGILTVGWNEIVELDDILIYIEKSFTRVKMVVIPVNQSRVWDVF